MFAIVFVLRLWPVWLVLAVVGIAWLVMTRRSRRRRTAQPPVEPPAPQVRSAATIAATLPPADSLEKSRHIQDQFRQQLLDLLERLSKAKTELNTKEGLRFRVTRIDDFYVVIRDERHRPPIVRRYVCPAEDFPSYYADEPRETCDHGNISTEGMQKTKVIDVRALYAEMHDAYVPHRD